MNILGLNITITRAKAMPPLRGVDSRGGWYPVVRESYPGAWQQNDEIRIENVMTFAAVYACVTIPAQDIGKLRPKLMQQDTRGVWIETDSPVLLARAPEAQSLPDADRVLRAVGDLEADARQHLRPEASRPAAAW